jgi:glycosyltransferase involved in cell wall biosynthesis
MAKPYVLVVTNADNTSFHTLGRTLARFLPDLNVQVLPHPKVPASTVCDVMVCLWWRPLTEGLLDRVRARSTVLAVFDHHSWSFSPLYGRQMRKALRAADYLAVGNEAILDQLRQKYDAIPPAWVCETGVDTRRFRTSPYPEEFTALWCGNSRAGEGDLKGLEIITESCVSAGVPLVIADSLGERGEAWPYAKMHDWYRQGTVFLVGSRSEGTPRTLLEALSCGRMAISTRVGIAPRVIQHGVNGLIVDRSPDAFSEGLRYLKGLLCSISPAMVQNAARRSAEAFDVRLKIEPWKACIMTALSGKWWRRSERQSPAVSDSAPGHSVEISELQGSPINYSECQALIDRADRGAPNRPRVIICSTYRFVSRTMRLILPLMGKYRFIMDDGTSNRPPQADLVWSFYPFADGARAVRLMQAQGIPFVMSMRGQFVHLGKGTIIAAVGIYRRATVVTALSQSLSDQITSLIPELKGRVKIIPNGNYCGNFHQNVTANVPYKRPIVLMLTNFNFEGKRAAAEEVAKAFSGTGITFLIAGREGHFAPPKGRLYGATYLGFVGNRYSLLSSADIFVYCSYVDGQPSALMEALSCGLPCVVLKSKNSGAHEFVTNGETGIVADSVEDVVRETKALIADTERAESLGRAAKNEMVRSYSWEAAADKFDLLFQQLLPQRKRRK